VLGQDRTIIASNGGQVALGGAISVASIQLSGAGSAIDARNVTSLFNTTVTTTGLPLVFPAVTKLTDVNLNAIAGGVLEFPQLATIDGGGARTMKADGKDGLGNGSRIDLSQATVLGQDRTIIASNGGQVALGGAISVASIQLSGAGSAIDFTAVTRLANTTVTAKDGGTVILPSDTAVVLANTVNINTSGTPVGKVINRAKLTALGTVTITGEFINEGELNPVSGGVFDFNGDLRLDAGGVVTGDSSGRVQIAGRLLGNAQDSGVNLSQAVIRFDGGTAAAPQLVEVMSQDRRASTLGFASSFAMRVLQITGGSTVRLVDSSDNALGTAGEAIYVETISVPPGTTLDLNGKLVYAANKTLGGTILNGEILDVNAPAGTLQLKVGSLITNENRGNVTVTVTRTAGSEGPVSVQLVTADGTARGGEHFGSVVRTVSFADGETTEKTVQIPIFDDSDADPDRTFTVALANPSVGAAIGKQRSATVTIYDDDVPPAITLENAVVAVEENAGRVSFVVTRTGSRGAPASVNFSFVNGTAVEGVDFDAAPGTLNFAIGETTKVISFDVLRRAGAQDARNFTVQLSRTDTDLGEKPSTSVTISDVAAGTITPGKPLTLVEGDNDRVVVAVSKGSVDREQLVVIRKDGEIVIPVLDLSENTTLNGAAISVREIVAAPPAPPAAARLSTFAFFAPPPATISANIGIRIGTVLLPETRDGVTLYVQGDVTQIVLTEASNVKKIVVDSFGEFQEDFPSITEPGLKVPAGYNKPIALVVNNDIEGATVVLPGKVTEFTVKGAVNDSTIQLGNQLAEFEIGSATRSTFQIGAPVALIDVLGAVTGSVFDVSSRVGSLRIAGDVQATDFLFARGGTSLVIKGQAAHSSVIVGAALNTLWISGESEDFGVNLPELPRPGDVATGEVGKVVIGGGASLLTASAAISQIVVGGMLENTTLVFPERVAAFVAESLSDTTLDFLNGAGAVTILGSVDDSQIRSNSTFGAVKIGDHLTGSVISALGVASPATAAKAQAIGSVSVSGRVERSTILAGFENGTAKNADVQIGTVTVGGDWIASSIGAGVNPGTDAEFGTTDDAAIAASATYRDLPTIPSRIGAIAIKGMVLGTFGGSDDFGFAAQQVGAFTVGATKFPLTNGADNLPVGVTGDVRVRELGGVAVATPAVRGLEISTDKRTATFTDVDGDLVTVKTSVGAFDTGQFGFGSASVVGGTPLHVLDIHDAPQFAGATLTITAARSAAGGDGWVNVGFLKARDGSTGIDLAKVVIDGDLGQIDVGDGNAAKPALGALSVYSMGRFGLGTQGAGGSLQSDLAGGVSAVAVANDLIGAQLRITGGAVGSMKVLGDLSRAALTTDATIGVLSVSGSVIASEISALGPQSGANKLAIAGITIAGNLDRSQILAGTDAAGRIGNPDAAIGAIKIGRDFIASTIAAAVDKRLGGFGNTDDRLFPGGTAAIAKIAAVVIEGTARSGAVLAEEIVAERVADVAAPLRKGPGNDDLEVEGVRFREVPGA
jgi:hypothetical protein